MAIQTASGTGNSFDDSLANVQLNEATDTVYGQLQKHTDFKSPVMKLVAQESLDKSSGRGLGNTTIAGRSAIAGVVAKAGEFATKDAELYSGRRTENQRANTHLTATAMSNQNTHKVGAERNEAGLEQQRISNAGQLAATKMQTESAERVAAKNVAAESARQSKALASQQLIAAQGNTSRQTIASRNNATTTAANQLDNKTRLDVAQTQQDTEVLRQNNQATQSAWDSFQNGVAQIDPNAHSASQKTQYSRLKENFQARMDFNNGLFAPNASPTNTSDIRVAPTRTAARGSTPSSSQTPTQGYVLPSLKSTAPTLTKAQAAALANLTAISGRRGGRLMATNFR